MLHDWDDKECQVILKNSADALVSGGRIIVIDYAVPDQSDPFFYEITKSDVFMMAITSGFYRTFSEYAKLWSISELRLIKVLKGTSTDPINTVWVLEK